MIDRPPAKEWFDRKKQRLIISSPIPEIKVLARPLLIREEWTLPITGDK